MSTVSETAKAPSIPTDQRISTGSRGDIAPAPIAPNGISHAQWIQAAHQRAITKAPERAMDLTDAHTELILRITAEANAERTGLTLNEAIADQVFSSAVHLMARAVELSDNPAGTLAALHAALSIVSGE